MTLPLQHAVLHHPLQPPYPAELEIIELGMGCFWGVERLFWSCQGVWSTATGYGGGHTANPSYAQVCTGSTQHAELVRIIFDPQIISVQTILELFWTGHDPTQGMRQGNDVGTQYRSVIYTHTADQLTLARNSKARYQAQLTAQQFGVITTDIAMADTFYFAEAMHQQYLAKNPDGYCGLQGLGVAFPHSSL